MQVSVILKSVSLWFSQFIRVIRAADGNRHDVVEEQSNKKQIYRSQRTLIEGFVRVNKYLTHYSGWKFRAIKYTLY